MPSASEQVDDTKGLLHGWEVDVRWVGSPEALQEGLLKQPRLVVLIAHMDAQLSGRKTPGFVGEDGGFCLVNREAVIGAFKGCNTELVLLSGCNSYESLGQAFQINHLTSVLHPPI